MSRVKQNQPICKSQGYDSRIMLDGSQIRRIAIKGLTDIENNATSRKETIQL